MLIRKRGIILCPDQVEAQEAEDLAVAREVAASAVEAEASTEALAEVIITITTDRTDFSSAQDLDFSADHMDITAEVVLADFWE